MLNFLKRRLAWVLGGLVLLALAVRSGVPAAPPSSDPPRPSRSPIAVKAETLSTEAPAEVAVVPGTLSQEAVTPAPRPTLRPGSAVTPTQSREEWQTRLAQHRKEQEPLVQEAKMKTEEARRLHDEQNALLRRAAGLPPSNARQPADPSAPQAPSTQPN